MGDSNRGKCALLAMIGTLMICIVVNFFSVMGLRFLALVPLTACTLVLVLVISGLPGAKWSIRIWAGLIFCAGVLEWLGFALQSLGWALKPDHGSFRSAVPSFTPAAVVVSSLYVGLGLWFIIKSADIVDASSELRRRKI